MDFPWRVKQRRAHQHLRKFADECAAYVRDAGVRLEYERDLAEGTVRVRLHADAEPPASLGATIGDILHNLRSALDAVAWETCQRAGVSVDRENKVYFPVCTDPRKWDSVAARNLPSVDDPARLEVFRQLQPWYWQEEARKVGVAVGSDSVEGHPLVKLNRLARVDRHRVPHPLLTRAGATWLGPRMTSRSRPNCSGATRSPARWSWSGRSARHQRRHWPPLQVR